jgi:hypothetical protein
MIFVGIILALLLTSSHCFVVKKSCNFSLRHYLSAQEKNVWKGSKTSLARKGQVPNPNYTPKDVIQVCLEALKSNDDPQLDHGACVVLEFRSPSGPLSILKDPKEYGDFLRNQKDYEILVDFKQGRLVGTAVEMGQPNSIRQTVQLIGWGDQINSSRHFFDFYLSKIDGNWLLDGIVKNNDILN